MALPPDPPRSVYITDAGGGVAVISLYRPPVNAMNGDVWAALLAALDACEAADAARVWALLTEPRVVATLGKVLARLARRKGDVLGEGGGERAKL